VVTTLDSSSSKKVLNTYFVLLLINTLAASLIWGVNTIFLLDAGLTNTQAFLANAFFTVGQVIFEVPTGIIADVQGRRVSYILGTITLALSTLLYLAGWYLHAPLWFWAVSSMLLGLGFTFFSGATEAWLVDALTFTKYEGSLDDVFAKGQVVGGAAMLTGAVVGGFVAQYFGLHVPYMLRAVLLLMTTVIAVLFMKDLGFTPEKGANFVKDFKRIFVSSAELGLKKRSIRWLMLSAPFSAGVGFYVFYAAQPLLLELYQDKTAYGIAGLAAAIVAGAQILGGLLVPKIMLVIKQRTVLLLLATVLTIGLLLALATVNNFWLAIGVLCLWGLLSAVITPVRQAYINAQIPSAQRATVLSFDSLMGSSGGIVIQPALGKTADVWGYPGSIMGAAVFQVLAVPFMVLTHREATRTKES
jgi:MFS family permease